MIRTTNSFQQLIATIEKKPAMYLGARTISNLKAFLDGWYLRDPEHITDESIMGDFQSFIEKKYNQKTSQSWANIILYYSADEYQALDNFFKLFQEFLLNKVTSTIK